MSSASSSPVIFPPLAEDIGVVMRPRHLAQVRAGAERGAHVPELVGDDAHPDAGGADQDAALGLATRHGASHLGSKDG